MDTFEKRRRALAETLAPAGLGLAIFEDTEGRRDQSIRYFTGQPGDSLLFIAADGRSVLVSWDVNMAKSMASVERILPYTDFGRNPYKAAAGVIAELGIPAGATIDLPAVTPYPMYIEYVEAMPDYDFRCVSGGSTVTAQTMRAIKDPGEMILYRQVSQLTDEVMETLEAYVRDGSLTTEADMALSIERLAREKFCEGTGFETLAAGPSRSFGIHAFPAYTAAAFASPGMSILDFGLSWHGYTSDVTMTFLRGTLNARQEKMVSLVQKAHDKALDMCRPGVKSRDVARMVDELFAAEGFTMPHALGHGIGLEAHEAPAVRNRDDNEWVLTPGHVITIEPGLYDPELGGVRLENDVLITEDGNQLLTHSHFVRLR